MPPHLFPVMSHNYCKKNLHNSLERFPREIAISLLQPRWNYRFVFSRRELTGDIDAGFLRDARISARREGAAMRRTMIISQVAPRVPKASRSSKDVPAPARLRPGPRENRECSLRLAPSATKMWQRDRRGTYPPILRSTNRRPSPSSRRDRSAGKVRSPARPVPRRAITVCLCSRFPTWLLPRQSSTRQA